MYSHQYFVVTLFAKIFRDLLYAHQFFRFSVFFRVKPISEQMITVIDSKDHGVGTQYGSIV